MSAQTSYTINAGQGYAGQLYDVNNNEIDSFDAEGAVPFGVVVGEGTNPNQCVPGVGNRVLGISVRSLDREGAANTGAIDYQDMSTVGVIRTGKIFAICVAGCVPGNTVDYDASGNLTTGGGGTVLANATWESTAAAGGIAVIRIGV